MSPQEAAEERQRSERAFCFNGSTAVEPLGFFEKKRDHPSSLIPEQGTLIKRTPGRVLLMWSVLLQNRCRSED